MVHFFLSGICIKSKCHKRTQGSSFHHVCFKDIATWFRKCQFFICTICLSLSNYTACHHTFIVKFICGVNRCGSNRSTNERIAKYVDCLFSLQVQKVIFAQVLATTTLVSFHTNNVHWTRSARNSTFCVLKMERTFKGIDARVEEKSETWNSYLM